MKIKELVNNFSKRLDSLDKPATVATAGNIFPYEANEYSDEYHIQMGTTPPRFEYYKQIRKDNPISENWWDYDARETMDELNFTLKARLHISPEERYRMAKERWEWHPSNNGCTNLRCISGCRFEAAYGRFEDNEVIAEHNGYVEHLRQKGEIMDIALPDNWRELIRKE